MVNNDDKPATVGDVREIVQEVVTEAVDTVMAGMERMFEAQNERLGRRFDRLEGDVKDIRRRAIDLDGHRFPQGTQLAESEG